MRTISILIGTIALAIVNCSEPIEVPSEDIPVDVVNTGVVNTDAGLINVDFVDSSNYALVRIADNNKIKTHPEQFYGFASSASHYPTPEQFHGIASSANQYTIPEQFHGIASSGSQYPINNVYGQNTGIITGPFPGSSEHVGQEPSADVKHGTSIHAGKGKYPGSSVHGGKGKYPGSSVHGSKGKYPASFVHGGKGKYPGTSSTGIQIGQFPSHGSSHIVRPVKGQHGVLIVRPTSGFPSGSSSSLPVRRPHRPNRPHGGLGYPNNQFPNGQYPNNHISGHYPGNQFPQGQYPGNHFPGNHISGQYPPRPHIIGQGGQYPQPGGYYPGGYYPGGQRPIGIGHYPITGQGGYYPGGTGNAIGSAVHGVVSGIVSGLGGGSRPHRPGHHGQGHHGQGHHGQGHHGQGHHGQGHQGRYGDHVMVLL